MTALRVAPGFAFGSRRSVRLIERNIFVYRHQWMMLLSGFFEPLFYLVGIGFGLGALVGTIPGPDGQPIRIVWPNRCHSAFGTRGVWRSPRATMTYRSPLCRYATG